MIAEVLCSGSSWNSSVSTTPILSSVEQLVELHLVLEVGARGVAPRVARPAVLLAEEPGERRAVLVGEAPLLADAPVPQLRERLGHLHREAVGEQVLLVLVRREQLALALRRPLTDGHHVERRVVGDPSCRPAGRSPRCRGSGPCAGAGSGTAAARRGGRRPSRRSGRRPRS